jgi:hypothetical protein
VKQRTAKKGDNQCLPTNGATIASLHNNGKYIANVMPTSFMFAADH